MIGHRGKRLCALLLALGLVPLGTAAVRTAPMEETVPVEITAPSAMLVEAETGTVIFEKNADEQRPVASVTKLMTLLLTFEALEEGTVSLEDQVTVSPRAASMGGSQAFLDAGERYKLSELLKTVIVASANDSAVALAEHLDGGVAVDGHDETAAEAAGLGEVGDVAAVQDVEDAVGHDDRMRKRGGALGELVHRADLAFKGRGG